MLLCEMMTGLFPWYRGPSDNLMTGSSTGSARYPVAMQCEELSVSPAA